MLISPTQHDFPSSAVSPNKNPASAADATDPGAAGEKAAGFREALENEMKGKDGMSNAESAGGNATADRASNSETIRAGAGREEMADRSVEIQDDVQDDEKEAAITTAMDAMASPSILLPNTAPSRVGDYSPDASTANLVDARARARSNGQADSGSLSGASQAELTAIATGKPGVAALQSDMAAAHFREIGTGTKPGLAAEIPTEIAAAAARTAARGDKAANRAPGQAPEIAAAMRRDAVFHSYIKDGAASRSSPTAGQGTPRLEAGTPEFGLAGVNLATEAEKWAQFPAELANHSLPATQAEAALTAAATARGTASAISAPASSLSAYAVSGLEPRLGAPGWDTALGQKVLWMVSQQQHVAELNLNPPDLGPLQVVLSINGDQASAMFVSQQADVRQALEAALPRLKEMMADSGINLSNTTVGSDSPQQQRESERQGRSGAGYGGSRMGGQGADVDAVHIRSGGNSLVDTFA